MDSHSAIGEVHREDGSLLGCRRYHIRFKQEYSDTTNLPNRDQVEGLRQPTLLIDWNGTEYETLFGKTLVLTVDSGERLAFDVTNRGGRVAFRHWLPPREGA